MPLTGEDCDAALHLASPAAAAAAASSASAAGHDPPACPPSDAPAAPGGWGGVRGALAVCHTGGCWVVMRGVGEGEHMLRLALVDAAGRPRQATAAAAAAAAAAVMLRRRP